MWNGDIGDTFLRPSGPGEKVHLFIVLTSPLRLDGYPPDQVLVVPICSVDPAIPHDPACTLGPGDHPFCIRDSYVSYAHAELVSRTRIAANVRNGTMRAREPFKPADVEIVLRQLSASDRTPRYLKNLAKQGALK